MFEIDSIAVHRKIGDTCDQTSEVLLNFDTSNLLLTVPIDFCDYVILALHECVLDLAPIGFSE